jgi:hypothetical protein
MTKFTMRFPELLNPEQRKKVLALVLGKNIVPLLVFAALPYAQAQAQVCSVGGQSCVYSVKFVCGEQPSPSPGPPAGPVVRPGYYATTINIHNYHLNQDQTASIQKTAVIAIPEPPSPATIKSQVSNTAFVTLPPGQAFEIDCLDIFHLFGKVPSPFIEGFVELRPTPTTAAFPLLSVTAVYTSQEIGTPVGGPVSIEVVPVQPFPGP